MLQHLILDIDAATIDWSRAQFALTAIYHWLFVPLTLGLAIIMGIIETRYYCTQKAVAQGRVSEADATFWKQTT